MYQVAVAMEKDPVQFTTKLRPFDPSLYGGETAREFEKFVRLYECKYRACDRKVPSTETDRDAWVANDKWIQLMGN